LVPEREQTAYRLALLIKKVRRQMSNAIRAELEPIGVSLPVIQIIKRVTTDGGLSQLELALELELEPAALSRLLAYLEAQRLVTRRRDPGDKRRVLMAPTASGTALVARAQPHVSAGIDATFSRLTRAEQGELRRLLEKLACYEEGAPRTAAVAASAAESAPARKKSSRPRTR
jgi:DNA-binding MarR family transcriptional regulator